MRFKNDTSLKVFLSSFFYFALKKRKKKNHINKKITSKLAGQDLKGGTL